jgi:hypothetical protein
MEGQKPLMKQMELTGSFSYRLVAAVMGDRLVVFVLSVRYKWICVAALRRSVFVCLCAHVLVDPLQFAGDVDVFLSSVKVSAGAILFVKNRNMVSLPFQSAFC